MMIRLLLFLILKNRYTLIWLNKSPIDRCARSFQSFPLWRPNHNQHLCADIFLQADEYFLDDIPGSEFAGSNGV